MRESYFLWKQLLFYAGGDLMAINDFFNVGYNPRFFYFKSLLNHDNPQAQVLANSAISQINNFGDMDFDDKDFLNSTKAGINLLYEMYQFEKNNEIRLIEEKVIPLAKAYKNGKYSKLADCIHDNEIDYISLMALLQKLTDDTEMYQQQLQDLLTTSQNFSDIAEEILKKKDIKSFTDIMRYRNEITTEVRLPENTKGKKVISELANAHARIGQYTNAIASSQTEVLFDYLKKNLAPMILNDETQRTIENNDAIAIGFYTTLLNKIIDLQKNTKEIENSNNKTLRQKLIEYMDKLISSEDSNNEELEYLKEQCTRLLKYSNILESEGSQLSHKLDKEGSTLTIGKNGKITNLTAPIRRALESQLPDKKVVENVTAIIRDDNGNIVDRSFNIMRKEDRQKYIEMLIHELIPEKENASVEEIVYELNKLIKRVGKRKEIITVSTEHGSALNLAYLTDAVFSAVDGYLNGKNDATLIVTGTGFLKSNQDEEIKITENVQQLIKNVIEQDNNLFDNFYKIYIKKENPNKKVNTNTFDIIAQTKAQAAAERLELIHLKEQLAQQGLQINDIRALFQIDDSAKFAETFIKTEGGFHGGSLGSDVLSQINNINTMLQWGGITPLDAERLMSMVLNAGDALIGASARPALENYFTTVGSMLMFRSGGNAIQEWRKQAQGQYNNSPTKIHIYQLGPVAVPESYVLLKTWETLNNCVNLLEVEAESTGSRVKIYNPVSDKDIKKDKNGVPNWQLTASDNYSKVKLEMVLMGGFLDLMEQMLDKMNSIV